MPFALALSTGCLLAGEPVAFFVTADPQYLAKDAEEPGALDPYSEVANRRFIGLISAFPGTAIPGAMGGGSVSRDIRGLLVAGDLIDSADETGGNFPARQRFEWARFGRDYGLTGKDGGIPFPVYELHGNHDGPQGDTFVIAEIIERNRRRPGIGHVSPNGLHYSWDWGPLHLVNLGIFVGEGEERRREHRYSPRSSLEFLRADLAREVGESGRPVAVSFHLHPNIDPFDWPPEDLRGFWEAIQGFNVVALFHGHTHRSPPNRMRWDGQRLAAELEGGVDVFNPDDTGAARSDPDRPGRGKGLGHGFLYVELIESDGQGELVVRSVATDDNWESHRWDQEWRKPVSLGTAAAAARAGE